MHNPFDDPHFFIGRKKKIDEVLKFLTTERPARNLSVVGHYECGKRSLVNAAVSRYEALRLPLDKRKIITTVDVMSCRDGDERDLFKAMIARSYSNLVELHPEMAEKLKDICENVARFHAFGWEEVRENTERYFKRLASMGFGSVCIMDNFDFAKTKFPYSHVFQEISELAESHKYHLKYIILSRKMIHDIEVECYGDSVGLNRRSEKHILGLFDENDIQEYFTVLDSVFNSSTEGVRDRIHHYCGNHPKFLRLMGQELASNSSDAMALSVELVDAIYEKYKIDFTRYYKQICAFYENYDELSAFRELVRGDVPKPHVLDYGFVCRENNNNRFYSAHFHEYLNRAYKGNASALNKAFQVYVAFDDQDQDFYNKLYTALNSLPYDRKVIVSSKSAIGFGPVKEQVLQLIESADRIFLVCSNSYFGRQSEELKAVIQYKHKLIPILYQPCILALQGLDDLRCIPDGPRCFLSLNPVEQEDCINKIVKLIADEVKNKDQ